MLLCSLAWEGVAGAEKDECHGEGEGRGETCDRKGKHPVAFLHWILMELISIKTVFRFELTQDYGLRYPLGHFRMVSSELTQRGTTSTFICTDLR